MSSISHLFFVDDNLIFVRATASKCLLKSILDAYEATSSQAINYEKSTLSFSPNTKLGEVEAIKEVFNIEVLSCHEKYSRAFSK